MIQRIAIALAFCLSFISFQSASVVDARDLLPIPDKLVVLTFDDANKSDRTFVAGILRKHGFGATFYVTEGLGFLKSKKHYTTWQEIRELHDMGFEIGNHTQHHRNVARLSREHLTSSIKHIDARCAEHGIAKPTTFCYPGFSNDLNAVRVLERLKFQFARRGVGPEFPDGGQGARGPAYDPASDHPLLVPTTGYAGPKWNFDDLKWAVGQAREGKICVLCFHGVPALEHPWVNTRPADFEKYMQCLKDQRCTVIATRDLVKYVDPDRRPSGPYAPIKDRMTKTHTLVATSVANPLGLNLNEVTFEWKIGVGKPTTHRILVASDPKKLAGGIGDLWDSGWRHFGEQKKVRYRGTPLPGGSEIWWKVGTRTDDGAGRYSEAASFKTPAAKTVQPRKRTAAADGGKPAFAAGKLGQSLALNATKAAIRIPDYPDLRPTSGTTISAWIRPSKPTDDWQTIFRKEDGNDRRLLAIGRTNDTWGLWLGLGINGRYHEFGAVYPRDKLGDGQWHHVAGTFDGKRLRLLVDGKPIGERELPGRLGPGATAPAYIGSYGRRQEPFHGEIDDVRVYERALVAEEIGKLAAAEDEVAQDSIVGRWKMDGNLDNEVTWTPEPAGNRIVFVGNTLISRMAKHGFLETAITARWPRHDITFRNLGWPADDVFGTARSEFGSAQNTRSWKPPSEERGFGYTTLLKQIEEARPTILIVGYGSEAAFAKDDASFKRFAEGYEQLLTALESSGAKIILLSPPRQEALGPPMPDPAKRNAQLKRAAAMIQELANKRKHGFVDLYEKLVAAKPDERLTDNGVHFSRRGYRQMAEVVLGELGIRSDAPRIELNEDGQVVQSGGAKLDDFVSTRRGIRFDVTAETLPTHAWSTPLTIKAVGANRLKIDGDIHGEAGDEQWKGGVAIASGPDFEQAERLRQLIVAKNRLHRYRIRPLNKTYIFLFRRHEMGHLAYEMDDLARLVEEKEELIARLRTPQSHRYELERIEAWKAPRNYPDHEVPKDIPSPDVATELKAFTVADGFELNLFAANPMIANPINVNWDARGRAWVSTSSTYPHIKPGREPNDRIIILEDTDRDGRADKSTVFAEGLLVPHSVMPVKGGAYVCSTTEFLFLADHDGDDRADERRVVYSGFGNADVHHMIHGLRWAPWGELYFIQSIYINSFIETPWGNRRLNGSGIWRFRPESERLEIFARGMVNPWGHAFDRWGQSFGTDGAGGSGPHFAFPGAAFPSAVGAERILPGLIPGKPKNTAAEFVSGRHMAERWHGSLLANDFRANRTVRYEIKEQRSGYTAAEVETVLHSSHRSFRPVDIKMGPDGAIYIVDWYNPIIDHGEVDFHHPRRDKTHGRIWRLTAKGRKPLEWPQVHGAPVGDLLELLKAPEQWTRVQAKRELANRDRSKVIPQLSRWLGSLDSADAEVEHHRLEALWLHGALEAPNAKLLSQVLASPDHRARAAGVRMVSHWFASVPRTLSMLAKAAEDDHPRVRLEAVNALRQVGSLDAASLALRALYYPTDRNLDYALWLTARETQDQWLPALQSGKTVFDGKLDRINFALSAARDSRAIGPLVELVRGKTIKGDQRRGAVRMISALGGPDELGFVLELAQNEPELLASIAEGAQINQQVPSNPAAVARFLDHDTALVRAAAAELAGRWKISPAKTQLIRIASSAAAARQDRLAAAIALARMGEVKTLEELASTNKPLPTRVAAIAAWARTKPTEAAGSAAGLLAEIKSPQDSELIYEAFATRKNGPNELAGALDGKKLPSAVAATGIRIAQASGRDLTAMIDALTRAGSLQPVSGALNPEKRRELLADVQRVGDISRGAKIFQRKALACTNCHVVDNAGGKLGPDLTSVGAYMTPESLLESLLNPSSSIKQGYETIVVERNNGRIVSGTLQRRTKTAALIRDKNGKIVSIPNGDIESIDTSPVSLMPQGLTESLRRDELVDLLRYLTSRGKKSPQ